MNRVHPLDSMRAWKGNWQLFDESIKFDYLNLTCGVIHVYPSFWQWADNTDFANDCYKYMYTL